MYTNRCNILYISVTSVTPSHFRNSVLVSKVQQEDCTHSKFIKMDTLWLEEGAQRI